MTPCSSLWSSSTPEHVPPCAMGFDSFCSTATVAPSSNADSAAGTPPVPAPTTTTSKVFSSAMSVMGSMTTGDSSKSLACKPAG